MANGRPLDPTGKALSSKSSPTRADSSARASAPTRPIKEPLRTDSTVSRYVISPAKKERRKKKQKKAEGTFPPFIPASDLTNEAIAQLKRREPSLSRFDVSSALKLRMIKKKHSRNKSMLKAEQ